MINVLCNMNCLIIRLEYQKAFYNLKVNGYFLWLARFMYFEIPLNDTHSIFC